MYHNVVLYMFIIYYIKYWISVLQYINMVIFNILSIK